MVYNIEMSRENKIFFICEDDSGRRLDRVVRKFLENIPLSGIYSAIRQGKIKINGKKQKGSYLTKKDDEILIDRSLFDPVQSADDNVLKASNKKKESKPLLKPDIILKTDDLLFINKRSGEVIHGEKSLCEAVLKYFPPKEKSLSFKTGALHRLDKDTSGILTFSQSLKGAQLFSKALRQGKISKIYLGITEGKPSLKEFRNKIDGKECLSLVNVIEFSKQKNLSLVLFNLITGRKHQIRIQCAQFGTPLLNDKKHNPKQKKISPAFSKIVSGTYFLHAYKLIFKESLLDGLPLEITAPLPDRFKIVIKSLFGIEAEKINIT
jgi:RNA pseudouridylate synthase family protein